MNIVRESLEAILPVVRVLWLEDGWAEGVGKHSRFFAFLFCSLVSYTLFKSLGDASVEQINSVIEATFSSMQGLIFGSIVFAIGAFAAYMSLVAATLGNSLIAKP